MNKTPWGLAGLSAVLSLCVILGAETSQTLSYLDAYSSASSLTLVQNHAGSGNVLGTTTVTDARIQQIITTANTLSYGSLTVDEQAALNTYLTANPYALINQNFSYFTPGSVFAWACSMGTGTTLSATAKSLGFVRYDAPSNRFVKTHLYSISLSPASLSIVRNSSATVTVNITDEAGTAVPLSSATVSASPAANLTLIKATANQLSVVANVAGSATITVSYGGASANLLVTVTNPAPICPAGSVALNSASININQTASASAPAGWTGGSFSSSNTSIATVSSSTITGKGIGTATISGSGWTYSNGATGCSLSGSVITVNGTTRITGVQGFNNGVYTNNQVTQGTYLIIYGSFTTISTTITINGLAFTPSYTSTSQINIPIAATAGSNYLALGSYTVKVTDSGGSATSGSFTVVSPVLTCPAGSVALNPTAININQTASASAPAGWTGGSFSSSNTSIATVSGSTITGKGVGTAVISGSGWTAPNGATGCSLSGLTITVNGTTKITGIQGFNNGVYTANSVVQGTSLVIYGVFTNLSTTITINGSAFTPSYTSTSQINVPIAAVAGANYLALGSYTVKVSDSGGSATSGSFSVVGPTLLPPSGYLDAPVNNATVSGAVSIAGWAIDNTSKIEGTVNRVEIFIDGTLVNNNSFGNTTRPDVCTATGGAYPGRMGCSNVGFAYSWNSSSTANGTHTIRVDIYDNDAPTAHKTTLGPITVTVNNPTTAIYGVQGQDGNTYTNNTVTQGTYLDIYGKFTANNTVITINGQSFNAIYISPTQINVPIAANPGQNYLALGSYTVKVTDSGGSATSGSFSVTGLSRAFPKMVRIAQSKAGTLYLPDSAAPTITTLSLNNLVTVDALTTGGNVCVGASCSDKWWIIRKAGGPSLYLPVVYTDSTNLTGLPVSPVDPLSYQTAINSLNSGASIDTVISQAESGGLDVEQSTNDDGYDYVEFFDPFTHDLVGTYSYDQDNYDVTLTGNNIVKGAQSCTTDQRVHVEVSSKGKLVGITKPYNIKFNSSGCSGDYCSYISKGVSDSVAAYNKAGAPVGTISTSPSDNSIEVTYSNSTILDGSAIGVTVFNGTFLGALSNLFGFNNKNYCEITIYNSKIDQFANSQNFTSAQKANYVGAVIEHEMGHCFGMLHNPNQAGTNKSYPYGSIMYPVVSPQMGKVGVMALSSDATGIVDFFTQVKAGSIGINKYTCRKNINLNDTYASPPDYVNFGCGSLGQPQCSEDPFNPFPFSPLMPIGSGCSSNQLSDGWVSTDDGGCRELMPETEVTFCPTETCTGGMPGTYLDEYGNPIGSGIYTGDSSGGGGTDECWDEDHFGITMESAEACWIEY